ncbi:MAG TPA: DUF1203 domain-containing protein [Micromonosporaceae bacterium]
MTTYTIEAIDPTSVKQLLISDDVRFSVDHEGGSPLRCCLRYAEPGEHVALASYRPLRRWAEETGAEPGPYDECGPVFVHADGCPQPVASKPYAGAPRHHTFRKYAADGHILGGRLIGADEEHERVLADMFADDEVALVHVRAVEFGCFFYAARRTTQ